MKFKTNFLKFFSNKKQSLKNQFLIISKTQIKNIKAFLLSLSLSLSLSRVIGFFKDFSKKRHALSWLKVTTLLTKRYNLYQLKVTQLFKEPPLLSQLKVTQFLKSPSLIAQLKITKLLTKLLSLYQLKVTQSFTKTLSLYKLKITQVLKSPSLLSQLKIIKFLKRYFSLSQIDPFAFSPPAFSSLTKHKPSHKTNIKTHFFLFWHKMEIIKRQVKELFSSSKAFSVTGALVASAIGLVITTGLSQMFVQTDSQIKKLEKKTQRIRLIAAIGDTMKVPGYCKATISPAANDLLSGTEHTKLYQLKTRTSGGGILVDLSKKQLIEQSYGIQGISYFDLTCEQDDNDCDCSSATRRSPCTKRWSFNLISQTVINNVPSFDGLVKTPIFVTFIGDPADSDENYACCQPGERMDGNVCVPIDCAAGQSLEGNECVCPAGQTKQGGSCVAITCPTGQRLQGSSCVAITCPTGQRLQGSSCVSITCPTGQRLQGSSCVSITCPTGQRLQGNSCVSITCPTGQRLQGSSCVSITCPTGQRLQGSSCVAITCPQYHSLRGNTCVRTSCPTGQRLQGNTCVTSTPPPSTPYRPSSCIAPVFYGGGREGHGAYVCPGGQHYDRGNEPACCPARQPVDPDRNRGR